MPTQAKLKSVTRLIHDRKGSTAIEFAVVAPIFLAAMFATFEVGWFFTTNAVLDNVVSSAARDIRTGQVQNSAEYTGNPDADLEDAIDVLYDNVCAVMDAWGDCDNRLRLEIQSFSDFASLRSDTQPFRCADAPDITTPTDSIDPGGELSVIRIRVCLIYNTINPAVGINLSEGAGTNRRKLFSTLIFRNEPYERNEDFGPGAGGGSS